MKKILYILVFLFCLFLVNNRINAYTEYKIGDIVKYNDIDFYVIKDSGSKETSVTMLKAEPLTVDEVNLYGGFGTNNNHINKYIGEKYTEDSSSNGYHRAYDQNGYGGMAYYTSFNCGDGSDSNHEFSGCITNYNLSEIKYVVDAWAKDKIVSGLQEARLITFDELVSNLGYELNSEQTGYSPSNTNTPKWVYKNNYSYWTMSQKDDSYNVFAVGIYSSLLAPAVYNIELVRPVITISKVALGDKDESVIEENIGNNTNNNLDNKTITNVKVENTYLNQSIIIILFGFIISCTSLTLYYIIKNKKEGK